VPIFQVRKLRFEKGSDLPEASWRKGASTLESRTLVRTPPPCHARSQPETHLPSLTHLPHPVQGHWPRISVMVMEGKLLVVLIVVNVHYIKPNHLSHFQCTVALSTFALYTRHHPPSLECFSPCRSKTIFTKDDLVSLGQPHSTFFLYDFDQGGVA
jgi:hypothetical protein